MTAVSTLPKEVGEGLDWLLNALNTEDIDIATDENLDHIEMNAYEDIAHYKDGTSRVIYHYCD